MNHEFREVDSFFVNDPFTEVYVYQDDGKAKHKRGIDEDTGRINYNSNPGGSYTQVPGPNGAAKDVWAIRFIDGVANRNKNEDNELTVRQGHATPGSPWKHSLIKIFSANIENYVNEKWDRIEWSGEPDTVAKEVAHKAAAIKKATLHTLAHEIIHSINVHGHCNHLNCLMRRTTPMKFYSEGVFHIVKQIENPAPPAKNLDEDLDREEFIDTKDILHQADFSDAHLNHLAVTGVPAPLDSISECSCVEILDEITTLPDAPGLGQITPTSETEVLVTWTPPIDDGGASIEDYEYQYRLADATDWGEVWTSAGSDNNETVSGLAAGTRYMIQVRAKNSVGYSDPSEAKSFETLSTTITVPGVPTGLTSTVSSGTVTLRWTAPANTGGGIDGYEYRKDPNNDGSWDEWTAVADGATSVTLMLENGRNYGFQVRAKNSAGPSTQSTKATALPVDPSVSVPSAPRSVTATALDGEVRLSWSAPSTGTPVIEYEYRIDTYDDGSWQVWKITGSTTTSYTVTGLTNETIYAFKVRARNAGGAGSQSSKVTATPTAVTVPPPQIPPSAPTGLTATAGNASVVLSWTAPTNTGTAPLTHYEYSYASGSVTGTYTDWASTGNTEVSFTVSPLTNGTTYYFIVRASSDHGDSGSTSVASSTPTNKTRPGAPQNFVALIDNRAVELWWDAPSDNGNTPITDYEYKYRESGGTWSSWTSTGVGAGTAINNIYTVTGLTNDTSYDFDVRAVNEIGAGTNAGSISETPEAQPPTTPTNLSAATGSTTGTVDLSWTVPDDDGGSPITHYEYRYKKMGSNWQRWTSYTTTDSTSTTYTVTGLDSGVSYRFRVRAVNAAGVSGSQRVAQATAR